MWKVWGQLHQHRAEGREFQIIGDATRAMYRWGRIYSDRGTDRNWQTVWL